MALTWDLIGIKDEKKVCWNGKNLSGPTNTLIWMTMTIGLPVITSANWREFYARCTFVERLCGAFQCRDGKEVRITPPDVIKHIGLRTNAQTWTKIQFIKAIGNSRMTEFEYATKNY